MFAVSGFKLGIFNVNFGGLHPSSDRFIAKTIVGYAFPAPGGNGATMQLPIALQGVMVDRLMADQKGPQLFSVCGRMPKLLAVPTRSRRIGVFGTVFATLLVQVPEPKDGAPQLAVTSAGPRV